MYQKGKKQMTTLCTKWLYVKYTKWL
jgi:hypothetical protein